MQYCMYKTVPGCMAAWCKLPVRSTSVVALRSLQKGSGCFLTNEHLGGCPLATYEWVSIYAIAHELLLAGCSTQFSLCLKSKSGLGDQLQVLALTTTDGAVTTDLAVWFHIPKPVYMLNYVHD